MKRSREMVQIEITSRVLLALLIISHLVISGCDSKLEVAAPPPMPAPASSPPTDTMPPAQIMGLIATDAYDGRINLWWDKSAADDFDHYTVYASQPEITSVVGIAPRQQIKDISITTYQVTGLEAGVTHYFAVTAVDKTGNENKNVTSVRSLSTPMPRGKIDPELGVDVYQPDKVWAGTTLLPDNHNPQKPRIIEVNMPGEIIWEYVVPDSLRRVSGRGLNPGFDAELLPNNNILFVSPGKGVYEIDRKGNVVWSYLTARISHDADRLPNGNTIFVCGDNDQKSDAQVTEVDSKGEVVWHWYARDHFDKPPYQDIFKQGWTHTNAVTRLTNGNTLVSLRNFNVMVEVDPQGTVVRTPGEGIYNSPHDPAVLANGNILAVSQWRDRPHSAIEMDPETGKTVWQFGIPLRENWPVRDANRLPNGNTLITGSTRIVEVTPDKNIVWQLTLKSVTFDISTEQGHNEASGLGFYKADRTGAER